MSILRSRVPPPRSLARPPAKLAAVAVVRQRVFAEALRTAAWVSSQLPKWRVLPGGRWETSAPGTAPGAWQPATAAAPTTGGLGALCTVVANGGFGSGGTLGDGTTLTELDASTAALVRVVSAPTYQFNGPDAMVLSGPTPSWRT